MIMLRSFCPFLVLFLLCLQASIAQQSGGKSVGNTNTNPSTSSPPSSSGSFTGSSTGSSKQHSSTHSITNSKSTTKSNKSSKKHVSTAPPATRTSSHSQSQQTSDANRNTTIPDIDLLPIRPEITPAFGITGVILMISGLAYTLIGVRKRWLSIFLSSGYLVALAVTVLILYVINLPVSNAIEGAYFVAAFVAGCIIGGLSLIFTEITEGLACLLGGFCLAMWFLVLKSGGLVTSVGGRVGMIASFSVVTFALAFSKYTRMYALIFSIAFAGATIVVLGIDCFSRAGLKEFWVYIWDINDDLFPLGTTSYPMTRGIKVEVAGIIILFLCGILSQWKLYKILKERKEKKALALLQDDEAREHLEADLGRQVEDVTARERTLWEQQYGSYAEKGQSTTSIADSGFPSRPQSTKDMIMNTREVNVVHAMELQNLAPPPGRTNSRTSLLSNSNENLRAYALDRIPEVESRPSSMVVGSPTGIHTASSLQPTIVPLPFTITEQEATSHENCPESLATVGDSAVDPDELVIPHIEDDRASSVAATLDELTDDEDHNSLPPISRSASPTARRTVRQNSKKVSLRRVGSASDLRRAPSLPDSAVSSKRRLSEPPPTDLVELLFNEPGPIQPEDLSNILNLSTSKRKSIESEVQTSRSGSVVLAATAVSLSAVKSIRRPSVAMQKYRTHEWTKYLSDAEQPLPGELNPSEDGIRVEHYSRESAAPVNIEDLQQLASSSKMSTGVARSFSDNLAHGNQQHSRQSLRSSSQPILTRNFSSPLISQPLVESPIEDIPDRSSTLLGMREDIIRKKASARDLHNSQIPNFGGSTFFHPNPSSAFSDTSSLHSFAPTHHRIDPDTISLSSLKQKMDEDNMPLSRRKTLIQQGQASRSIHRLSSGSNQSYDLASSQHQIYDAHLPQRGPSVDAYTRQARMATFRESLRNGLGPASNPAQQDAGNEGHRFAMLNEKRQVQAQLQQREYQKQALDNIVDQGMRNGAMLDLHKERLRRMQSQTGLISKP